VHNILLDKGNRYIVTVVQTIQHLVDNTNIPNHSVNIEDGVSSWVRLVQNDNNAFGVKSKL